MSRRFVLGAAALLAVAGAAQADNVITNGGFETGDYTGWTSNTLAGSNGSISVTNLTAGSALPHSGQAAAGPAGGQYYSSVDQGGAGGYEVYQAFSVPANSLVNYSFDLFARDGSGAAPLNPTFFGEGGLSAQAAQYVRVDILDSMGGVLQNLALLGSNGGYQNFAGDLTGLLGAGGNFTFRFRHFDNQFFYHTTIDNVVMDVQVVPLPAGAGIAAAGLVLVGFFRRR
jgi:hypothetical protein